jgi:formylglycine-generating enzyme required for sulfatase activity
MTRTKNTPPDTTSRVFHGGGWSDYVPSWVRAASRSANEPAGRDSFVGFRCALRGRQPR